MSDPLYDRIERDVDGILAQWRSRVLSGGCTSYEDYKFHVGLIGGAERGLELAKARLIEAQRELDLR